MRKSLEEMCRLVTGYGAWHIGDIQVSDGPHGVRAQEDGAKNNDSYVFSDGEQRSVLLESESDRTNGGKHCAGGKGAWRFRGVGTRNKYQTIPSLRKEF